MKKIRLQSLRLQRMNVTHSIRKNVQDFAKLLDFFTYKNEFFWVLMQANH